MYRHKNVESSHFIKIAENYNAVMLVGREKLVFIAEKEIEKSVMNLSEKFSRLITYGKIRKKPKSTFRKIA